MGVGLRGPGDRARVDPGFVREGGNPDKRLVGGRRDVDYLSYMVGDRGQEGQLVGAYGLDPKLQGQVGYHRYKVGVASPLTVTVDATLDVVCALEDRGQRVGHGATRVVMEVHPQAAPHERAHLRYDLGHLMGQRPAVCVTKDRGRPTALDDSQELAREAGVLRVAIEEMLCVHKDAFAVAPQK